MSQAEEWKEGYKVCSRIDGGWRSAVYETLGNEYWIDKPAVPRPGNGPLMVFTDLCSARRFAAFFTHDGGVFQCRYRPSDETDVWRIRTDGTKEVSTVLWKGDPFQDKAGKDLADEVVLLGEALPI